MVRKKRNIIDSLKDDRDVRITDKTELKRMAVSYFKNLYSDEGLAMVDSFPIKGGFPRLESHLLNNLEADITAEEIKDAFFGMGALKAPGPDGYHAMFFQSQWHTIGDSICRFIKDCFKDPSKINGINYTNVVLIPKIENPDTLKHFRLIALCNVIYKAITKIIANRLKPLLRDLISPTQCSFISGRHSSDNMIIAQEIIHSMANNRGKWLLKLISEKCMIG